MKPLTKTVAGRSGGIAARFAAADKAGRVRHVEVETPRPRAQSPSASFDTTPPAKPKKPRYERWRDKNPELYKERQAEYMRKRRAKEAKKEE